MSNAPLLLRKGPSKSLSMGSATRTSLFLGAPRTLLDSTQGNLVASNKRRSLLSTPASTNKRRQSNGTNSLTSSTNIPSAKNLQANSQNQNTQNNTQNQPIQNNNHLQPNLPTLSNRTSQSNQPLHRVSFPPSSQGSQTPQIRSSQIALQTLQVDQRPLRDKGYQQLIQQQIYDFLVTNKYEVETKQPITPKMLRQPTQKEFTTMFKFLYRRLDPQYEFQRSIEVEIFALLKSLGYPYLDTINRLQISAVGGQNWPLFLGVLYWMVKLGGAVAEIDAQADAQFASPDDEFDRLFIAYIRDLYQEFISERDDYSEFYERLQTDFRRLNAQLVLDAARLEGENDTLRTQHGALEQQLDELRFAERKSLALEDDLIKFRAYIEAMEGRRLKWGEILGKIKAEIAAKEGELDALTAQLKALEAEIELHGTSVGDINSMNAERDRLLRAIDAQTERMEIVRHAVDSREIELTKSHQSLQNFVQTYNAMVSRFTRTEHVFEIHVKPRENISASDVIDKELKEEKIALLSYRGELNTRIHQYEDEHIRLAEARDAASERIVEQTEQVESLTHKVTQNKVNYDEIYEAMVNDNTTYSTQIEKLERELRLIKINTNQGFIELENQYQNVMIAHDELQHTVSKARQELYDRCCKMAEFIMNFKFHIQTSLLDLDDLAQAEYENAVAAKGHEARR